jgi:hypothetical protein
MADVRAMLRAERAARNTASSKSKQPAPATSPVNSKKRKAADPKVAEIVKRLRAEEEGRDKGDAPENAYDGEAVSEAKQRKARKLSIERPAKTAPEVDARPPIPGATSTKAQDKAVNEDDWASFEADIANLESEPVLQPTIPSVNSGATITRAPMTAEEVAAEQEREKRRHRRREEELELEKEDAAAALQEEFDEIERLEDRARKVRELREKLRERQPKDDTEHQEEVHGQPAPEDQEEDDDEDDLDDWFG